MWLETEEVQQKPKRTTFFRRFRTDQFMKHMIAFAVTGLVAMCRFDEELGIPKDISILVIVTLFIMAYIFRKRIFIINEKRQRFTNEKKAIVIVYFLSIVSSIAALYYDHIFGIPSRLAYKIVSLIPILPILYFVVLDIFKPRI
ncbi:hypothetical protein [Microvirga sp. TS319]|uniref:hypothetical protein n=1 Tax=Microvirga sp. TS319 TaxID=3241165 RepID=UPI00351A5DB4